MAATTVAEPYPFVQCVTRTVDDESHVFSPSTSTGHMQPFSGQTEQCAMVHNLMTCRSQNLDSVQSVVPVGSWPGTSDSYNAIDYRTVRDAEYLQSAGNSLTAYATPVPSEATAGAYQRSSYQSADWSAGYQSVAGGHSMCNPADTEDTKERHVSCSQLSASVSSDQLVDSDQSSDAWSPSVSAKKIKQVLPVRTEHFRRTTQAASRRASTGSLLCTTVPDLVSCLLCLAISKLVTNDN